MMAYEYDSMDAPVWNAAVTACLDAISDATDAQVWGRIAALIRPELSAEQMSAEAESTRAMMLEAADNHANRTRAIDALRPFVADYRKAANPGTDDLYDEQPFNVRVTLGDCRRAHMALVWIDGPPEPTTADAEATP